MRNLPITIPATKEVVYDSWFYTNYRCDNLQDSKNAKITFDRVPKSQDGQYLFSHKETYTKSFWDVVSDIPEAASVMQQVIAILPTIAAYEKPIPPKEDE